MENMNIIAKINGGVITESHDVSFGYFTVKFTEKSEVITDYMQLQDNNSTNKRAINKTLYPLIQKCVIWR